MDRRSFFRRLAGRPEPLRPPFALPEAEFVEACNGCSDCVKACPEGIVRIDSLGFAEVDFASGGCTFCDACAQSCGRGAFYQQRAARAPWDAKALVAENCLEHKGVACRACESACEAAAIVFCRRPCGATRVVINERTCTGCGACVAPCPVQALAVRVGANQYQPVLEGQR
ncbi:MAG TPA: ferredoxin-type protein NapF [Hyphomicrobiales bacterium]|nr:ferredoxin-type protein NapF [Rhodobiaceae bacterium]HXK53167.1 ferredoxin-type protein NapF [Hyphomicrobiales bacterium]